MHSTYIPIIAILFMGFIVTVSCEQPIAPPNADRIAGVEQSLLQRDIEGEFPQFSEWSTPTNLGPIINSEYAELAPSISKDGRSLFFFSNLPGGYGLPDIWVSERSTVDAPWETPQNVGSTINSEAWEFAPFVSHDGHRLYFASNIDGGFGNADLYVARRRDKRDNFDWLSVENLGSTINTAAVEDGAALFENEQQGTLTLYFYSNRPGGQGADDIYASQLNERKDDGAFGPAIKMEEANSPYLDRLPFIRRDGLEMFITSNRPGTYGALDLWVLTRTSLSKPWSKPKNLGPTINSEAIDGRAVLSHDGTVLFYHSTRSEGFGYFDLYMSTRSKLKMHD